VRRRSTSARNGPFAPDRVEEPTSGGEKEAVRVGAFADRVHRLYVPLPVQLDVVAQRAVEVRRQVRDAQDRARGDEMYVAVAGHQAAGESELPVKPRAQQRPPVHLDAQLLPAR
jgi:hypothetical protein